MYIYLFNICTVYENMFMGVQRISSFDTIGFIEFVLRSGDG